MKLIPACSGGGEIMAYFYMDYSVQKDNKQEIIKMIGDQVNELVLMLRFMS